MLKKEIITQIIIAVSVLAIMLYAISGLQGVFRGLVAIILGWIIGLIISEIF